MVFQHWFRIKGDGHRSIFPSKTSEVCRQWWDGTKIHWAHHEECLMVRWIYPLFHFLIMAHGELLDLWRNISTFFLLMMVADGFIMNLPVVSNTTRSERGMWIMARASMEFFVIFFHSWWYVERSPTHINSHQLSVSNQGDVGTNLKVGYTCD